MADAPDALAREIAYFDREKSALESHHMGKWVVICDAALVGVYDELPTAAWDAERKYGDRQFLLRQVGFRAEMAFPVSVMASG